MSGASITRELERKLTPPDGFDLAAFADAPVAEHRFTSAYWDTETGTLRRAGLTLRRRTEGRSSVWQLKLPAGSARNEVEVAGKTAVPPELVALLHAHIALGGPLQEIARLRTRRLVALVENARGRVEIAHDTVDILDGRRKTATFSELELELKDGQPGALKRLAKKIDAEPAPTATKLDRAFGPLDSDTAPLLTRLLRAQLDAILAHDPGVRLGGQAEDVHQMRVALRRTLACVRGGAEWLDATWVEEIRPEIDWVLHALGAARDADVFHAWLRAQAAQLDADARALKRLDARLERVRADEHAAVRAMLDDPRYVVLLERLAAPPVADAEPRFRGLAASEVERLRSLARKAGKRPDDELLHRLRLRGKRVRYALELAEPELGKRGRDAISAARKLQDVLGEHQDAVQAELRLRELGASTRGGTAVALGRLVELQQPRRKAARRAFSAAWSRFDDAVSKAL